MVALKKPFLYLLYVSFYSLFLGEFSVSAQTSSPQIPSPQQWFDSLDPKVWLQASGVPHSLHIGLRKESKLPAQRIEELSEALWGKSFIRFIPRSDFRFGNRLGSFPGFAPAKTNPRGSFPISLSLELTSSRAHAYHFKDGGRTKLARWEYPQDILYSEQTLLNWIRDRLAYDAVVLDVKEPYILAAFVNPSKKAEQALLIEKSAERLVLNPKTMEAHAILQTLRVEGVFVVLERLIASDEQSSITVGTKIVMGTSELPTETIEASPKPSEPEVNSGPPPKANGN